MKIDKFREGVFVCTDALSCVIDCVNDEDAQITIRKRSEGATLYCRISENHGNIGEHLDRLLSLSQEFDEDPINFIDEMNIFKAYCEALGVA